MTITVYLNLSESAFPREWYDWARAAVTNWLVEFGPVEVVLDRPDRYPGSYVEVRYGPSLAHMSRRMGRPIASLCTTRLFDGGFFGEWYPQVIWHDERIVRAPRGGTPHQLIEALVTATVHEFAHALGWDAEHKPEEQSREWWAMTKKNFPTCAANLAVYAREKTDA